MPNYEVTFKVNSNTLTNIQITALSERQAVELASKMFKVGVREVGKLITSKDYDEPLHN